MQAATTTPSTTIWLTEKEYLKIAKSHFEKDKDKLAEAINSGSFFLDEGVLVSKYKD